LRYVLAATWYAFLCGCHSCCDLERPTLRVSTPSCAGCVYFWGCTSYNFLVISYNTALWFNWFKSCRNRKSVIFLRMFVTMGTCKDPVGLTYIFVFTFLIRVFHDTVPLMDVTNTTQNRVFQFVSVSSAGHCKPLSLPSVFPL
jgi:hypothetical protein